MIPSPGGGRPVRTARFIPTLVVPAVVIWLLAGGYVVLRDGPDLGEELGFVILSGTFAGLLAVGVHYLVLQAHEIRNFRFPPDELREGEVVLKVSRSLHFPGRNQLWLWDAVGGGLFLTDQRIVFVTYRMQFRYYRLSFELDHILKAEAGEGLRPGELWLTTQQGQDLFTFGALGYLDAEEWAAAILLARYRAHPDREWSEGA
jgi:hypothetical protein